jgi:sporulation protein YlmC with PRC-barrel domain
MNAKKFAIAKQLGGKRIITNRGEEIGRLSDMTVDEGSGRIETLIVEPNLASKLARDLSSSKERLVSIPYKAVFAVGDVIVVDESLLV